MRYQTTTDGVSADDLRGGFFVGWPNPPSPETHLRVLQQSSYVVLARADDGQVVGFITAVSDNVLSAYIPLLEVLPTYQHRGIGRMLVRTMLDLLADYYMVDLLCDAALQSFYEGVGMRRAVGMMRRNYERQAGSAQGNGT